ncbi:MAG: hypothetical protein BGO69_05420 [Bacteroidetes bacterium 46-16]|nr:MAG: hypothetical protein BGO69_05420 [Bacteroidetes bacterium 46-16]
MSREHDLKVEVLDSLKQSMPGCFGSEDGIFAGHPADEKRAKELRRIATDKGISLNEVLQIAQEYMQRKNYIKEHIEEQMTEIRKFFSKKLQ